jgi:hypothetical protein
MWWYIYLILCIAKFFVIRRIGMDNSNSRVLDDLGTIRAFLEEGQKHLDESGFHFILWGTLIPVATVVSYVLEASLPQGNAFLSLYWPLVAGIGAIVSVIAGILTGQKRRVRNFASKVNAFFWQGFLVAAVVLSVIDLTQRPGSIPLYLSHLSILLGLAYWIHGSMLGLPWFRRFALAWWLASPALAFLDWSIAAWVMAGTTFVSSFIPGIILRRSANARSRNG